MKYTALEILEIAGIEKPEDKFDKISIRIGGVVCNDPNKIINVQNAKTVDVLVGTQVEEVNLPEPAEPSEAVKVALKAKGAAATEAANALQAQKKGEPGEADQTEAE